MSNTIYKHNGNYTNKLKVLALGDGDMHYNMHND